MPPHLYMRGSHGHKPNRQGALPKVVVKHRDRLVQPPEAVAVGHELVRQVAEVLLVHPVIRVQVRDHDLLAIEAETRQLAVQPPPAVGHCARLAYDHAGLKRVQDVEEVAERRAKRLAQFGHVLATLKIRLTGDDRDHPQVSREVGIRQRLDSLIELLVRLRIGWDEGDVPELTRVRDRLLEGKQPLHAALLPDQAQYLATSALGGQLVAGSLQFSRAQLDARDQVGQLIVASLGVGQREGPLPPVDRQHAPNPPERYANADGQHDGAVQPVKVEAENE